MSAQSLPHAPTREKPQPPPIVAMLRKLAVSIAERDAVVTANVADLARTLEGRGHENE